MTRIVSRTLVVALVAVALASGGSLAGWAEQTAPAPDVLSALLTEVRGLRAALEQMATAGPRVQLALGRVQLQEQRIAGQIRRLDVVRQSLVPAQQGLEALERKARELDTMLRHGDSPYGPEGIGAAKEELKELQAEVARRRAEVQRLTLEETSLMQDIGAEQSRWTEFNQRLEELERALGRR
jgi:hypothetical protein